MVGEVKSVNGNCQASKEFCGGVSAEEDLVEGKGNKMADVIIDKNLQFNLVNDFAYVLDDNSIHLENLLASKEFTHYSNYATRSLSQKDS